MTPPDHADEQARAWQRAHGDDDEPTDEELEERRQDAIDRFRDNQRDQETP